MDMNEKTAREMIEQIGKWLEDGAPGASVDDYFESIPAHLARAFSYNLLECANADGLGGCSLCQG